MSDREEAASEASGALLCGETGWHHGMMDCMSDGFMTCLTRTVCSSCTWGRAVEIALEKNCILCCLCGGYCICCTRGHLREKYNIDGGSPLCDAAKSFLPIVSFLNFHMLIQEIEDRENKKIGCLGKVEGGGEMAR